ncbi:UNVERIFIED_CONTAM: hypothetical protein FKN15_012293 [Acipenser sinensis]
MPYFGDGSKKMHMTSKLKNTRNGGLEKFKKIGKTEEESPLPFPELPPDVVEMKVKEGSKIRNLMGFAMSRMEDPLDPQQHSYQPPESLTGLWTPEEDFIEEASLSLRGAKRPLLSPSPEPGSKRLSVEPPQHLVD